MQKATRPAQTTTHAVQEPLRAQRKALQQSLPATGYSGNQAALRRLSRTTPHGQFKLQIGAVNDPLEAEADRVADQVMRMSDPAITSTEAPQILHRKCAGCEEENDKKLQAKPAGAPLPSVAPEIVSEALRSPGQGLDATTRHFFEPRLGHDLSAVRVHTDPAATESARAVNALAYTSGNHVVFADGQFSPGSTRGRRLLAHELAHVFQQSTGRVGHRTQTVHSGADVASPMSGESPIVHSGGGASNHVVQRVPGDGMVPPGDCAWSTYLPLRAIVEAAKAVVDALGACTINDSCPVLATKIAAIAAEIAARVALSQPVSKAATLATAGRCKTRSIPSTAVIGSSVAWLRSEAGCRGRGRRCCCCCRCRSSGRYRRRAG